MSANTPLFFNYSVTVRSKTTWGSDTIVQSVPACIDPMASVTAAAQNMGAVLTSVVLEDPLATVRGQLKECLGFVGAWQAHLEETGQTKAAATVKDVLERSQVALRYSVAQPG